MGPLVKTQNICLFFYQTVIEIVFLFFSCRMLGFFKKVDLNQNGKSM